MHTKVETAHPQVERVIPTATYPPRLLAWYTVIVLFLAYTMSYVDRTIIALLVDPIKTDFNLNDTQFSLLTGFAFALMYTTMGLPMGWLVDRVNRRMIVLTGIVTWSLATIGCGLSRNFGQLFAGRVMVGVGEATLTPAAESIIADMFPPHRRASAFATYNLGVSLGSGLALIIGGTVIHFVGSSLLVDVPVLGPLKPWQITMVLAGIPGLLIALLVLTLPEPVRHGVMKGGAKLTSGDAFRFLWERKGAFVALIAGTAFMASTNAAFSAWVPAMMTRTHGWTQSAVGHTYGSIALVFGLLGAMTTLTFGDRLLARFNTMTMATFYVVAACFQIMAALSPNPYVTLALISVPAFALGTTPGLSAAMLQNITPNQFRGQFIALHLVCSALLASGLGPIIPALLSDHVFGEDGVRYSLATMAAIFPPIAAGLMVLSSRYIPALIKARDWE